MTKLKLMRKRILLSVAALLTFAGVAVIAPNAAHATTYNCFTRTAGGSIYKSASSQNSTLHACTLARQKYAGESGLPTNYYVACTWVGSTHDIYVIYAASGC